MNGRELELKAVVEDAGALAARLRAGGARLDFRGRMSDRRYDTGRRELEARDEVLRLRTFVAAPGAAGRPSELTWKGPTCRREGYKEREEHQLELADPGAAELILTRLGFEVSDAIDRCVEFYGWRGAVVRLEWYPRMDVLLEVEGAPAAIEDAAHGTGLARVSFTADRLLDFAARYEARTGRKAALALAELEPGETPGWPDWAPAASAQTSEGG